uniref:Uncharacterized protein n=1 Tax=Glossina brevipalpis TaxID=37001 RepID=A0A1A9WNK7_9MUSC
MHDATAKILKSNKGMSFASAQYEYLCVVELFHRRKLRNSEILYASYLMSVLIISTSSISSASFSSNSFSSSLASTYEIWYSGKPSSIRSSHSSSSRARRSLRSTAGETSKALFHISRLYFMGALHRFSNSKLGSMANSLRAVLRLLLTSYTTVFEIFINAALGLGSCLVIK